MGQTPHTLLSLRGYLYSLRGEDPLRPSAYGAAAGRRGEWGGVGLLVCGYVLLWGGRQTTIGSSLTIYTTVRNCRTV